MRIFHGLELPTRARDWKVMGRVVRLVLSMPQYTMFAVIYGLLGLSVFVFARNVTILQRVIVFGTLPLESRFHVLIQMYPGIGSAYTVTQTVMLVATAALVGINLSMVTYHFREHGVSLREGSGGVSGVVLGILGGGCAACGSAVFAGLLSMVGAAGVLTILPLDGLEFALLALAILMLSIYWLAEGMRGGEIAGCPVEFTSEGGK